MRDDKKLGRYDELSRCLLDLRRSLSILCAVMLGTVVASISLGLMELFRVEVTLPREGALILLGLLGSGLYFLFLDGKANIHVKRALALAGKVNGGRVLGRFVLRLVPARSRDYLLGDIEEEYREVVCKYGPFRSRCWWWLQVLGVVGPYGWARMRRALGVDALRKFLR